MIDSVLEYQKKGLFVYRLAPKAKVPLWKTSGFNEATNNSEQLVKWWSDTPNANIGIHLKMSGLVVIDVDRHENGADGVGNLRQLFEKFSPFPPTYTERTPRNGFHFFFKVPAGIELEQNSNVLQDYFQTEKTGIDVITYGIPVAPTVVRNLGTYRVLDNRSLDEIVELPSWLVNLLNHKEEMNAETNFKNSNKKYTGAFLDEMVAGASTGNRNEFIMKMISKMLAVGADLSTIYQLMTVINENFIDEPLEEKELNTIFKSRVKKHTRGGH